MLVYFTFITVLLLLSTLKVRKAGYFLAILVSFFFVGLRYETGFDWPVYKGVFESLRQNYSWENILYQSLISSHEISFVAFLGLIAQVLPRYEYVQAICTLFFLLSFFRLATTIPGSRPVLALAVFFSFYLTSIGFSTVRQTLAISLFNWGLSSYLRGGRWKAYVFMTLAATAQISSLIYFAGFLVSRSSISKALFTPIPFSFISIIFMLSFPSLTELVAMGIPFFESKLAFYRQLSFSSYFGILTTCLLVSVFLIGLMAAHFLQRRNNAPDGIPTVFLCLISVLSAFAVGSFFFSVLRERISYEILLLFSIFLSTQLVKTRTYVLAAVIGFGLIVQTRLYFQDPFYLAFVPYQNGVMLWLTGRESTGAARSQLYSDIFEEQFR
jgi:hypothetical protein